MKHTLHYLPFLLLALLAGTAHAAPASVGGSTYMLPLVGMTQNAQGDKTPPPAQEQTSPEPPIKAVPMTERKSKPQRVETSGARGPREMRGARGARGPEAGRGAQGGGRGMGRGLGRGHGN